MTRNRMHVGAACLASALAGPANAQVSSSEFYSDPVAEGWNLFDDYCAETWVDAGWYFQRFDLLSCLQVSGGEQDAFVRSISKFDGEPRFFLQFRVETNGDRSEIPGGAPVGVAMSNNAGVGYHVTVASDLVKFLRDVDLPILFIDVEPGIPRTYRIELYPDRYAFYIDGELIDEGPPEGPYPAYDARISWLGRAWNIPCENAWDYIRYGVVPVDGSGDYDSDGVASLSDFYFVQECLSNQRLGINGGPGNDAGPGCRFADFDSDGDTDLLDFAEFQIRFAGSTP